MSAPTGPSGAADRIAAPDLQKRGAARLSESAVLERLRRLPGGPEVLQLAARRADVELVGGAVRDLLLDRAPREIDLVLDGEPASFTSSAALFARDLVALLPATAQARVEVSVHERFGTAAVRWSGGRVDIAARRSERYAHPGALPDVCPGTPEQDLLRRDFTVNAIAVPLGGEHASAMRAVEHALHDLDARMLRVLHDRSFEEDPTRLLRLARYAARLGFAVESHTALLAQAALSGGALRTISAARIGAELRLALTEGDMPHTLQSLSQLGVLEALDPPMRLDSELLRHALDLLPADGRPDLLALGCLLMRTAATPAGAKQLREALERFEHPGSERRPVLEAALRSIPLAKQIAATSSPSQLWDLLCGVPIEAVALAGALAERDGDREANAAAKLWLQKIRATRLQITGDDLLGAGVPAGPEIGDRLRKALRARLDKTIGEGRDAELRAALER